PGSSSSDPRGGFENGRSRGSPPRAERSSPSRSKRRAERAITARKECHSAQAGCVSPASSSSGGGSMPHPSKGSAGLDPPRKSQSKLKTASVIATIQSPSAAAESEQSGTVPPAKR